MHLSTGIPLSFNNIFILVEAIIISRHILCITITINNASFEDIHLIDGVVDLGSLTSKEIIQFQKDTKGFPCFHNHFYGEDACLCSINCRFVSGFSFNSEVSSPITKRFKKPLDVAVDLFSIPLGFLKKHVWLFVCLLVFSILEALTSVKICQSL